MGLEMDKELFAMLLSMGIMTLVWGGSEIIVAVCEWRERRAENQPT